MYLICMFECMYMCMDILYMCAYGIYILLLIIWLNQFSNIIEFSAWLGYKMNEYIYAHSSLQTIFYTRVRLPEYISYISYMYPICMFLCMYMCMYILYMCA